jgi:hypothetical protein
MRVTGNEQGKGHMTEKAYIKYFGWSCIEVHTPQGKLFFDPICRPYCGVQWSKLEDFEGAKVICVTHGHQEHYRDLHIIAKHTGATVIGPRWVCTHVSRMYGVPRSQTMPIEEWQTHEILGCKISAFLWRHRDISPIRAVFRPKIHEGIKWAWNGLLKSPFTAPYTGYHVELPSGERILNYNEGFNYNLQLDEVREVARRYPTDVLLGGMQMHFEEYVAAGAGVFQPKEVMLYHPHKALFQQIRVKSSPPEAFAEAVRKALPEAAVYAAEEGWVRPRDGA